MEWGACMGLEKVTEEIMGKGLAEQRRILAEGEAEASQIKKAGSQSTKAIMERAMGAAQEMAKRLRVQELSIAHVEVKKVRLNAEKEMLDKVYSDCLGELSRLSPDAAAPLLEASMQKIKKELGTQGASVQCNQRESQIVKGLCDRLNLTYSGVIDCAGGVVAESRDGSLRLDLRYETILDDVWTQKIKEISNILFG